MRTVKLVTPLLPLRSNLFSHTRVQKRLFTLSHHSCPAPGHSTNFLEHVVRGLCDNVLNMFSFSPSEPYLQMQAVWKRVAGGMVCLSWRECYRNPGNNQEVVLGAIAISHPMRMKHVNVMRLQAHTKTDMDIETRNVMFFLPTALFVCLRNWNSSTHQATLREREVYVIGVGYRSAPCSGKGLH
jgi:hypothetical protein